MKLAKYPHQAESYKLLFKLTSAPVWPDSTIHTARPLNLYACSFVQLYPEAFVEMSILSQYPM